MRLHLFEKITFVDINYASPDYRPLTSKEHTFETIIV